MDRDLSKGNPGSSPQGPRHFSVVYGLRVCSNVPLPGLFSVSAFHEPDLQVRMGSVPPDWQWNALPPDAPRYASPDRAPSKEPTLRVWKLGSGRAYLFRYADATQFFLDGRGTSVWATWPDSLTLEDAATYLLGPVLGFVLRLRGITCLHASAVVSNGGAIALVGPPGAGKSTTAAALASRGLSVLSDDVLPLEARDSGFWVKPGYPRLNLWPDSAGSLYGSPERLPLITPGWPKRFVDVAQPPFAFHREAAPLRAVYMLEGNSEEHAPQIHPANDHAGLISLVANTYSNYLLDATMRASEFALLGRLASRVPLRRLRFAPVPESFSLLPETLLTDMASLSRSPGW